MKRNAAARRLIHKAAILGGRVSVWRVPVPLYKSPLKGTVGLLAKGFLTSHPLLFVGHHVPHQGPE